MTAAQRINMTVAQQREQYCWIGFGDIIHRKYTAQLQNLGAFMLREILLYVDFESSM